MRVLLLSSNTGDKAFFEAVTNNVGLSFQVFSTPQQLVDDLSRDSDALVLVDASTQALYAAFEQCVSNKIGLYSALVNPNHYFYISSLPFYATPWLHTSQMFGNYIQRNFKEEDKELVSQILLRGSKDQVFEVEKYFSPMAKIQVTKLKKTTDKYAIVESLKDYLLRWGMNTRAVVQVCNGADELLLNALFESPADELGKAIYANVQRNTPMDLDPSQYVEFKVVHDDRSIGISVTDNYGSLDRGRLIAAISRTYRNDEYKVKPNVASAGLGLSDTFYHSGGMIFASEPGTKLEAMLIYNKYESYRSFREQLRFLSFYTPST